jgi:hypothetical protein
VFRCFVVGFFAGMDTSDEHGNGKFIGDARGRTVDPAAPAVPALIRKGDYGSVFFHFQHIPRAVLSAFPAHLAMSTAKASACLPHGSFILLESQVRLLE